MFYKRWWNIAIVSKPVSVGEGVEGGAITGYKWRNSGSGACRAGPPLIMVLSATDTLPITTLLVTQINN